jgi:hypothetical protein
MFKTVDSIVSSLYKTVNELRVQQNKELDKAQAKELQAIALKDQAMQHSADATRASRVASRIEELLS